MSPLVPPRPPALQSGPRSGRRRWAVSGAAVATVLAGSLLPAQTSVAQTSAAQTSAAPSSPASAVTGTPAYRDASLPTARRVADLLERMTLEEKVGQMTQAERLDIDADPSLLTEWGLGSVLSGGGSTPEQNTPQAWADMVDEYQRAALDTRLGIPLIYGVDSVHGHGNLMGATVFPHNIGLGATRDPRLLKRIGHITAIETRASGPQWTFAPCVCVARDDRWGRTYESFGEDPELVKSMATVIDGLQGRPGQLDNADRVLATAKHFAGDGLTSYDESKVGTGEYPIDQGIAEVSRREFRKLALSPFPTAIDQHRVGSVMPSFSSVDWTEDGLGNPVKLHASRELVTGVLKKRMGFEGFVVSDWRAIHQIPGDYAAQVEASVNAGVDMFMEPYSGDTVGWREFITTLTGLVESGDVRMARIDDAVSRILMAKFELGLFEHPFTDRRHIDAIGGRAHRAVARQAVAKSQVLLKNEDRTLPLKRNTREVYVAGSNADSIGSQAGGWTITWQGNSTHEIPGDSILEGIEKAAKRNVTFSEDASAPIPARAHGVVVVGETPYTEGFGDVGGPLWAWDPGETGPRPEQAMKLSTADRRAVRTVCAQAATCTVLVVSGRPMILPPKLLKQMDALVASWLPGSEGRGVADVLFGRERFTGKLPVSWPRRMAQEPINVGDAGYRPLYRYGFGLSR
ncbi:glycoside hydrolase family 3 protein [Nocardioides sp.]|uniref:glycoside hydrolase family 3 protein n=1 Tax=Nocardioides sp. TaxID=35761 RepID=UPI00356496A5